MDRTDRMRKKQTRIYRNQQEQTGIDRIISDIENYCIIKKFIYQIGNSEVKENPAEKKRDGQKKKKKKKKAVSKTAQDRSQKYKHFIMLDRP